MKKPVEFLILILLLVILSINGLAGGALMIIEPYGSMLGMEIAWLANTPFGNYLVPGILLFTMNGVLPALALVGILAKKRCRIMQKLNIYNDKYWGWTFSLYSGITTLVWIIVQQLITTFFILQPIVAAIGLLIVICSLMPRVQTLFVLSLDQKVV